MSNAPILMISLFALLLQNCQDTKSTNSQQYEGYIWVKSILSPNASRSTSQEIISSDTLMLYKNYLIETRVVYNFLNNKAVNSDTIGYFFIDLNKQIYAEYKILSKDAKKISTGKLTDKLVGLNFFDENKDIFDKTFNLTVKDTSIHKEPYKVATAIKKGTTGTFQLKAYVNIKIQNFPVQFSGIISEKTGGGLTEKIEKTNLKYSNGLIVQMGYKEAKLPDSIIQLIKDWKSRLLIVDK